MPSLPQIKNFVKLDPRAWAGDFVKDVIDPRTDVSASFDLPFNGSHNTQTQQNKNQGGQNPGQGHDNGVPGPSGVLGASTTSGANGYNPADVALIEAGIGTANSSLGSLDQQYNVGAGNIGNSYNSALNRLLGSKAAAEGQFNTSRTRAQQDNLDARSQIDASVGRNANSLQRLLGSRGAGNSDAARIAAPYAAAFQGTQQRAGVEKDYSRDMADLDTNYNTYNTGWNQSRDELDQQRFQQEQALKADVATKRQTLLSSLAELSAKKAAAAGGNSAAALAAAQPYTNQVSALNNEITNLGAQYNKPISVDAPQYQQGDVGAYQYDTALGANVANPSALTDTVSPAYATLIGANKRKLQGAL